LACRFAYGRAGPVILVACVPAVVQVMCDYEDNPDFDAAK
jgi:hypothetical protein